MIFIPTEIDELIWEDHITKQHYTDKAIATRYGLTVHDVKMVIKKMRTRKLKESVINSRLRITGR